MENFFGTPRKINPTGSFLMRKRIKTGGGLKTLQQILLFFELFEETLSCGSHFSLSFFGRLFVIHAAFGLGDYLLLFDQSSKLFESLFDGVSLFQVYRYQTNHLPLNF
jgi:hypothetical protein